MFTTNSGADVPKATMVNPITRSETLYFFASAEAPLTSKSAPLIRTPRPSARSKLFTNIFSRINSDAKKQIFRRLAKRVRSEEHTSELQSRENLVCRLLLEKK